MGAPDHWAAAATVFALGAATLLRLAPGQGHDTPATTTGVGLFLVAGGVPERRATLAWWHIGRAWADGQQLAPEVLVDSLNRIGEDDPSWRTPWIYGGLMLQTQGDAAAAEPVLTAAAARWPDDPWFPGALGVQMADQGRLDEARAWLDEARERQ